MRRHSARGNHVNDSIISSVDAETDMWLCKCSTKQKVTGREYFNFGPMSTQYILTKKRATSKYFHPTRLETIYSTAMKLFMCTVGST